MGFRKSAQVATEIIMTYGWIFIFFMASASALTYFGFFEPEKFVQDKCQLSAGLDCNDLAVYKNGITIAIKNKRETPVLITKASLATCVQDMSTERYAVINSGETLKIPIYNCKIEGDYINEQLDFEILFKPSNVVHEDFGTIRAPIIKQDHPLVVADSLSSTEKLCARAEYFQSCPYLTYLDASPDPLSCCSSYNYCCD